MKKKLLVFALVLVLTLSLSLALVACKPDDGKAPASELERAKDAVYRLYKDSIPAETAASYKLSVMVPLDGIYSYPITWTVSDSRITISEPSNNQVTIEIPDEPAEAISYTLKATITADDGTTATVEFQRTVPEFVLFTWDEFLAADDGATVVIDGIVTAVLPYGNGASNRGIYMQTEDDAGALYVYNPTEESVAGVEVGMKVRVTGAKDDYYGTLQIAAGGTVEIIDETKTTVTPKDYTEIYTNAADLEDATLIAEPSKLVTIKGVTIGSQGSDPTYFYFTLAGKQSYVRISGSSCPLTTEEQNQFKTFFLEHFGATADVTGIVTLYNGAFYLTPVSADAFTNVTTVTYTDAEMVQRVKDALTLTNKIEEAMTLELPSAPFHKDEVTVTWTVSENTVGELNTDATTGAQSFVVAALPSEEVTLTFTATLTCGDVTDTATFTVVVSKEYVAEDVEYIDLTADSLGLTNQYLDGLAGISGVKFEYIQLYKGDNGIQMRFKDGVSSSLHNANAFAKGIVRIELTLNSGKTVYDNTDVFSFKFGTSADNLGAEIKLSTVSGQTKYTITLDQGTYTYFSMTKIIEDYTFYVDSIRIIFVDEITLSPADKIAEEKAALDLETTSYTQNGTATLPVVGTTHTDVTIAWSANNSAVVIDGANMTLTMPAASARIVLTATLTCGEATDTKEFVVFAVVDVMDAIALLQHKDSFVAPYTITGTVKEITDAYSEQYGNVTLVITVGTLDLECYRLSGDAAATVKVGDEIVVTGTEVSKYNDDIELRYAEAAFATVSEKTDAEKVADDKAALTLEESYTENFTLPTAGSNGSTIAWAVTEGTAITLDGASATVVRGDVDATVVLTATITCGTASDTKTFTVTVPQAGSVEPPVEDVMTVAEALAAANALGKDEYSAEKVYVEGVVTEITRFDSGRSSYTFYIKDADGTDQLTVFSCKTTADITKIYVGDTVKVYGYLKNHKGNTPEVTYQGDENPVFVTLTRGTSAITVAENDNVTVTLSAQSGENGTEFSFTIVVDTPEYVLASVAVNGTTVTATDGVYRAIIDGPTTVVVSGYVPSTETSNVTVDFKANFGTYGGSWSNSYAEHTITSADLGVDASEATFNVVLSNASKQTGTITDMPCLASKNTAQYVTVSLSSGTIAGVTFNLKEWSAKKMFTTITIEYTTDGATWQPTNVGLVDGTATTISPNFTTVSAVDLAEGVIGVRLVYVGSSTSKNMQIGLEGLALTVK